MASVTRLTGLRNTVGISYSDNCNIFKVTVKNNSASAIDLRAEDDAVDETVEYIVKELNPLAFHVVDGSSGLIYLVMDKNVNNPVELQQRIRNLGSAVGANGIDVRGTTAAPAFTFTTTSALSTVVITGTAGQFSCAATPQTLVVGQAVTISGTAGGTGSITGYSDPTTYLISATNGSTTFTLTTTAGSAIITTAGTPTGLTYTLV
jgi:hypothetical protein